MAAPTTRDLGRNWRAPQLWDIEAVADRLGVQVRHVRRLVNERRIPFIKWGHLLRFDPVEIEEWLDGSRRPPAQESGGWYWRTLLASMTHR